MYSRCHDVELSLAGELRRELQVLTRKESIERLDVIDLSLHLLPRMQNQDPRRSTSVSNGRDKELEESVDGKRPNRGLVTNNRDKQQGRG